MFSEYVNAFTERNGVLVVDDVMVYVNETGAMVQFCISVINISATVETPFDVSLVVTDGSASKSDYNYV